MLTHQGPPIPALHQLQDGQFRVLAGPFSSKAVAATAARRIEMDLGESGRAVRLPQSVASQALTPSAMEPFN